MQEDNAEVGSGGVIGTDRKYVRLVRLAYLVLPATGRRKYRLAIAQRIVDRSVPHGDWPYAPMRARVLRRAMRPRRRLRIGLGRRLRSLPQAPPATPEELAAVDPAVRAAYVLRRAESLPRYLVRDQLLDVGVADPMAVVKVADAVPELELPLVVPGPPMRRRSRLPLAAAGAVTVAVVAIAQTDVLARPMARHTQVPVPVSVAPSPSPVRTQTVSTVFWTGRLPGGARGRWICTRAAGPATSPAKGPIPGPAKAHATFIAGRHRRQTGDCGDGAVSTTWWRAPDGRWYFLAAGGPHLVVRVTRHRSIRTRDGLVIVPGPRWPRPPRGRIPVRASSSRT